MDLADPRVNQLIGACEQGLKRLLQTERADVFMFAANGHGAWESVIVNLVAPGQAVLVGPGVDVEAMRSVAREQFQVAISGGLGPLAGRVFRIGHLGDMNPAMILGCLAGVEAAMRVQGVRFGRGGVAAAVDRLAQGNVLP